MDERSMHHTCSKDNGSGECNKLTLEQNEDFVNVREQIIDMIKQVGESDGDCAQRYLIRTVVESFMPSPEEAFEEMETRIKSIMGFELDSNGEVKSVEPGEMPDIIRGILDNITGMKTDDEQEEDDEEDEKETADGLLDILAKSMKNRQEKAEMLARARSIFGKHVPGEQLEAVPSSNDLKYFEKYMKSWTKKHVREELEDIFDDVSKLVKRNSKELIKLMERTNRKIRDDVSNEIFQSVASNFSVHNRDHHTPKKRGSKDVAQTDNDGLLEPYHNNNTPVKLVSEETRGRKKKN